MTELIYNVHHQEAFGILIASYFYLTGISAGSFILSTLIYVFDMKQYKEVGRMSVILAIVVLLIAPIALLAHSGMPLRAWRLFYNINLTSAISFGSFLLTLYPINCIFYAVFIFREDVRLTRIFGIIGIPLAISVHGYCGFILGCAKARHLWNSAIMPMLFLVSAIVSGIAVIIFALYIRDKYIRKTDKINEDLIYRLGRIMANFLILDLFLVLSDIIILFIGPTDAMRVGQLLTMGKFAFPFLGIENIMGKIVPILLIMIPAFRTPKRVVFASVLVIIGIFVMRYVVVYAGEYYPLI